MFDFFKKNEVVSALNTYSVNISFLYRNLKKLDKINFEDARNVVQCLVVYHLKEIVENSIFDTLDLTSKCMIPEMFGLKMVPIAKVSIEINIILDTLIEKYNLRKEYIEILQKEELYKIFENCYQK